MSFGKIGTFKYSSLIRTQNANLFVYSLVGNYLKTFKKFINSISFLSVYLSVQFKIRNTYVLQLLAVCISMNILFVKISKFFTKCGNYCHPIQMEIIDTKKYVYFVVGNL